MSGYLTHMAVGVAGGVVLARVAPWAADTPLLQVALPLASGLLATWPDVDHPDAWVSRRVVPAVALGGGLWAAVVVTAASLVELAAVAALGALVSYALALVILWLLRRLAGGHRGATHGLVTPVILATIWLAMAGTGPWQWLPALLAWGWLLHLLADVVTPAGWRPLAPWRGPVVRLPRAIARHGETLVSVVALSIVAAGLGLPSLLAMVAGAVAGVTLAMRRRTRGAA